MTADRFQTFEGEICGFGTASGHRVVIGRWTRSPFGSFCDVMHEAPDGVRTLVAPSSAIAEFVGDTYVFDVVRIVPVVAERSHERLEVDAGDLSATIATGSRTVAGWGLHLIPAPIARARWWCRLIDPAVRRVMRGVRTRGSASNSRQEWYGATDQHRLSWIRASIAGEDLGGLTDVWPPVRFGFSSTPRTPSTVRVTTTILDPDRPRT